MLFMRFAPLGNHAFAASGTGQVAEVTTGTRCAISPTKELTSEERTALEVFMQIQGDCSRSEGCQGAQNLC